MKEDKAKICYLLLPVLQETRNLSDLTSLTYIPGQEEYVEARFKNGYKKVIDVTANSGTAMIKDIVSRLA